MVRRAIIHASKGYPLRGGTDRFDPEFPDRPHYLQSDADRDRMFMAPSMPVYGRQHKKSSHVPIGHTTKVTRSRGDSKYPEYIGFDMVVTDETLEGSRIINSYLSGQKIGISFGYIPGSVQFSGDHVAVTEIPYYDQCEADSVITCNKPLGIAPANETKEPITIIMSAPAPADPPAESKKEAAPPPPSEGGSDKYREFFMRTNKAHVDGLYGAAESMQLDPKDAGIQALVEGAYGNIELETARTFFTGLLTSHQELERLKAKEKTPDVEGMMNDANAVTVDHSKPKTSGHPFADSKDVAKSVFEQLNSITIKRAVRPGNE